MARFATNARGSLTPCAENSREVAKSAKFGHRCRQSPSRLRVFRVRPYHYPTPIPHAKSAKFGHGCREAPSRLLREALFVTPVHHLTRMHAGERGVRVLPTPRCSIACATSLPGAKMSEVPGLPLDAIATPGSVSSPGSRQAGMGYQAQEYRSQQYHLNNCLK